MSFLIILAASFLTSLGVGGGALTSLYFTVIMNIDIKLATTASIILFIPTAIISVCIGYKNRYVKLKYSLLISLGGVVGCLIGFFIWNAVETEIIRSIFAGFLIIFGVLEFFVKKT